MTGAASSTIGSTVTHDSNHDLTQWPTNVPVASVEWDRIAGLLEARGVPSQADSGILLVSCDSYSRLVATRHAGRSD